MIARILGLLVAALAIGSLGVRAARADAPELDLPVFGRSTFSMTSMTTLRYRGSNYDPNPHDDDFGSLAQRFDLALQGDELRLEVRVDGFLPTTTFEPVRCPPEEESLCRIAWDLRPERMTLRWEHERWLVELGDSQLVLGRGIALAFRKVDLLAIDTALRGAHVRYDGEVLDVRLHGGVANPQNQDPITLEIRPEPLDVVVGGQVGITLPGPTPIAIAGHAARLWPENDPGGIVGLDDRTIDVAGWSLEASALADGRLTLYAEADGLRRQWRLASELEQDFGRAVYASAQMNGDELTVLLEWAEYRNFLVASSIAEGVESRIYGAPPPIEYEGPQQVRALGNRRGGSVRVDDAFLPGPWSVSVNESLYGFAEEAGRDPWDGVLVSHTWATLARRQEYGEPIVWSLNLVGGYRRETLLYDPTPGIGTDVGAGGLDREMIHAQAEATIGSGEHSFDLSADHRSETWRTFGGHRRFEVGGASITYSWGVPLTCTIGLRWSDFRPDERMRREERDYNVLGGPSLEARWSFDPGTFLRLFAGQTPGGQICSGGVCRTVPAFEGFLLQFVGRL